MIQEVEQTRQQLSHSTEAETKSLFGQFLTPATTANFMASLFPNGEGACRLLDAGAGIGSLSAAFLERWKNGDFDFSRVELQAFEYDTQLIPYLSRTVAQANHLKGFTGHIIQGDFIDIAVKSLTRDIFADSILKPFTHAILNPPYKKIRSDSPHRRWLRDAGIETVNLYSGFVALALALAAPRGQVVAIVPRSFCNGPYYRPFRDFILERAAICHIHLFESRNNAFKDDAVLQENIIIRLERGGQQGTVTVTTSTDDTFSDLSTYEHPFGRIVFPDDRERFIHVPTSAQKGTIELSPAVRYSLTEVGINVSTGPVVDFRLKDHLRAMPEKGAIPLIYPGHLRPDGAVWPIPGSKKPNAIMRNDETEKWLFPNGFYCAVRRFSSKEEKRRVVARVIDPTAFGEHSVLGFENHLNLYHENKHGLPEALAYGLTVFLNTTAVDEYFRRFSGHTQVNATDLKLIKYPSRNTLTRLGEWAMQPQGALTQEQIDAKFDTLTE